MPPSTKIPENPVKSHATSEFEAAHEAGRLLGLLQNQVTNLPGDSTPFAIINGQPYSLREFMAPRLGKMTPVFCDPDSFMAYVNRFKNSASLIFAQFKIASGSFQAVLDYPAPGDQTRKEHFAHFDAQPTEAWNALLNAQGKPLNQDAFCEYVEKYRALFADPTGLQMLDIARYIEGKKEGQFTFGKRLQTGDRQIIWKEETQLRAGATGGESLDIPEQVTLLLALFEGTDPVNVKAWLRVIVSGGAVSFKLDIQNLADTVRGALDNIRITIRDETALPVFLGSPGPNAA